MSDRSDPFFSASRMFRLLPGWRGNLLLFGVLIGIVLSYFFWQVRSIQATFMTYAREHARMLAGVVEQNARGALLSQQIIEEILDLFLGNTALFVDDLDAVKPFSDEELTNFAEQNGLAGIFIRREDGTTAMGPTAWIQGTDALCQRRSHALQHLSDQHLYVTVWRRTSGGGCIGAGIEDLAIDRLQEKIGLDRLLTTLKGLPGIRDVQLIQGEAMDKGGLQEIDPENVVFLEDEDGRVAEVRRILEEGVLLVRLDAGQFTFRVHQIWGEFFLFSAVLAILGGFFSWLLHRLQQWYFRHIRSVERELAREREDAALGRSAAAIAHEIRNPLNAIGMGLQRLRMETETLEEGERELIATMLRALKRADGIIENIRLYARPLQPKRQPILFGELVKDIWALYEGRCNDQGISAEIDIRKEHSLQGDPHLLSQAIENLIKNSIEAQPEGGFLTLQTFYRGQECLFRIENSGFRLSPKEADQILEPYYTTKTRGTGLGLAIVRKTVLAHGGRMTVSVPEPGVLRVTLRLPLQAQPVKEAHADTDR